MNTNILATVAGLSDQDLLERLSRLTAREREASVELIAHLAVLDARPAVYAAQGYGSLFGYCTQALRLSEDAACNRIEAARACRRFPLVLDLLSSGSMSLTAVRMVGRHLTIENHQAILARASGRSLRDIEMLIAELAPRPDVPASVRKLPTREGPCPAAQPPAVPGMAPSSVSPAPPTQAISALAEPGLAVVVSPEPFAPTPPGRRPGDSAGAVSRAVHDGSGIPREASPRSGPPPPRDSGRGSWRHLRARPGLAARKSREDQARCLGSPVGIDRWERAGASLSVYPSRDG